MTFPFAPAARRQRTVHHSRAIQPAPSHRPRRPRRAAAVLTAAASAVVAGAAASPALAVDRYWISGSGLWNSTLNWSATPGGVSGASVPTTGDGANIVHNDAVSRTITYNTSNPGALFTLTLNNQGTGTNSLTHNSGILAATTVYVGTSGRGAYNLGAGTSNLGILHLGYSVTGDGRFTQTAGALNTNETRVGFAGTGLFTQSGGAHTVSSNLLLGYFFNGDSFPVGNGTYRLPGGTLLVGGTATGTISVGLEGIGTFEQTGGAATTGTLQVGQHAYPTWQSQGTYTLSNGTLATYDQYVGNRGVGTFNQSGGTSTATAVYVGYSNLISGTNTLYGTGTYTLDAGSLDARMLNIGQGGKGTFNQNGGSVVTNSDPGGGGGIEMAVNPGSSATYNLKNGSLTVAGIGSANFGVLGTAAFNQEGGTFTTLGNLRLGITRSGTSAGSGTYALSGGALLVGDAASPGTGVTAVGHNANGAFVQSGGSHRAGNVYLGFGPTAQGAYTLSGGTLDALAGVYVGYNGAGQFVHSGGTTTTNLLYVGAFVSGTNPASAGTYSLQGNAALIVNSSAFVGQGGTGTFDQTGGTFHFTGANPGTGLILGSQYGSSGTYNLHGGSVSVSNQANLVVGGAGAGTFNQHGGSVAARVLIMAGAPASGTNPASAGLYHLDGGTLDVRRRVSIGDLGTGTFVQGGGSFTVNAAATGEGLVLGAVAGSSGTYALNAGNLTVVAPNGFEFVGSDGTGTLNQNGGAHSVGNWMVLGLNAGGRGFYNLADGTLSSPGQSIGYRSTEQSLFTQTGGTNTASSFITVGDQVDGLGRYNLQNGSLNPFTFNIAWQGNGVFNQTGGTLTTSSYRLGHEPSGSGTATVSAGTITVSGSSYVGLSGRGNFTQSGGTQTFTTGGFNGLYVGYNPDAVGNYTLSGGTLSLTQNSAQLYVGYMGTGSFTQSGGTNTAFWVTTGYQPGGTGTYTLTGGTLNVTNAQFVGWGGDGSVNHTGGTSNSNVLLIGNLSNGTNAGATGTYTLGGGGVLNVALQTQVGIDAIGHFVQNGGTHAISGTNNADGLFIGFNAEGVGDYAMRGGTLNVPSRLVVGNAGDGVFSHSGGTVNVTNRVTLANSPGSTGLYDLSGNGTLRGPVVNNVNGTFNQSAGTFTGTFTNHGTINFSGGSFNAPLLQSPSGQLNVAGQMTLPSGLTNSGNVTITPGGRLAANGPGLNNDGGALHLTGGSLGGSGPLLSTGHISGFGTINPGSAFTNHGQIAQGAGNLALGPSGGTVNYGSIDLVAARQLQVNSALTNHGSIRLNGGIVSGPGPLANEVGGLITGPGTIHAAPLQKGSILLDTAGTLTLVGGVTNQGSILLNHAAAHLAGGAIRNDATGVVTGQGHVANALDNHGTVHAVGGMLTLGGTLANPSGGLLRAGPGAKILALGGLAQNHGTIDLAGGQFDNANKPLLNTGTISARGGTLAAGAVTNAGTIAFTGGDSDVFGPLDNAATGKVIVTGGGGATFHHALSGPAGAEIRVSTNSTAVFLAPVTGPFTFTGTGAKYFEAGASAVGPVAAGGVTVVQPAAALAATQILEQSLDVRGDVVLQSGGGTSRVNELSITGGGRLDLTDNALIVDYDGPSPVADVRADILAAYAGGSWTGDGLTSSVLLTDTRLGLGYGESADIYGPAGGTFEGLPMDATAVLARVTLKGDVTLDGVVNFDDLARLAQNYNNLDGNRLWTHGDFTYDGNVNFDDLAVMAQNYNTALPGAPVPGAGAGFNADLAAIANAVPVPEPAFAAWCVVMAAPLLLRRRRSR